MITALAPVVQTLLALINGLLPAIGASGNSVASQIIAAMENVIPIIAAESAPLLNEIRSIIAALRNGATPLSADQLTALDALDAQIDAAFEADAAAAGFAPPAGS